MVMMSGEREMDWTEIHINGMNGESIRSEKESMRGW